MELPKRKPTRLKEFDYSSAGYYFITVCTHNRQNLFGNIVGQGLAPADIRLSELGKIANNEILNLENRYKNIKIDKYIIMPNHIHAIIIINPKAAGASPCPTLSDVVCAFKSLTATKCRKIYPTKTIWQTSFHDHIIRNENDYKEIYEYIDLNPKKWELDEFYK